MFGTKLTLKRLFLMLMYFMAIAILLRYRRSVQSINTVEVHPRNAMHYYIENRNSNSPKQEKQINEQELSLDMNSPKHKSGFENKGNFQGIDMSSSDDTSTDKASDVHPLRNKGGDFNTDNRLSDQQSHNDTKIILWYVKARYINPTPNLKQLTNCPYRCSFTTNKDYHKVSSALFFSAIVLSGEIPPKRYDDQVFILHNHEPQCVFSKNHAIFKDSWKSCFNWTMWYREDSDIHEPYGHIVKRTQVPEKDFTEIYHKKTRMAAAMVSNCHGQSKRMEYIRKLVTLGVEIDVFGACGEHSCPRGSDVECRKDINKKYKFFLSFESSFCHDYITEKFFHPYQGDIVTVVRGGGNYSRDAPQGTYINTQDFKNIKDVADYIIRLSKLKDEYIDILKRKNEYESLDEPYPHINERGRPTYFTYHYEEKPMCDLCRRLWNIENYRKSYSDIRNWFNKSKCFPVKDI